MTVYLLDSNVFISAHRLHYGLDFCPAFWEWLVRANKGGSVFSVARVAGELAGREDDLSEWADERGDEFFLPEEAPLLAALARVAEWVNGDAQYTAAAKNTFLQVADYYLVAQALASAHTVVTHEKPENSKHRVKIPNACIGVGVKYMNPFEMLRRERARCVLRTSTGSEGTLFDRAS